MVSSFTLMLAQIELKGETFTEQLMCLFKAFETLHDQIFKNYIQFMKDKWRMERILSGLIWLIGQVRSTSHYMRQKLGRTKTQASNQSLHLLQWSKGLWGSALPWRLLILTRRSTNWSLALNIRKRKEEKMWSPVMPSGRQLFQNMANYTRKLWTAGLTTGALITEKPGYGLHTCLLIAQWKERSQLLRTSSPRNESTHQRQLMTWVTSSQTQDLMLPSLLSRKYARLKGVTWVMTQIFRMGQANSC